jgi:enoyl-CoA hydratase/carnithine racemase
VLFALSGLVPLGTSSPVEQQHSSPKLPWERTKFTGFGTLTTTSSNNGTVLRVLMDNPPINLYDYKLITDLYDLLSSVVPENVTVSTPAPKVMIFSSADSDFWMGHYDGTLFGPNPPFNVSYTNEIFTMNRAITGMLKSLPTILIAEINGRATGSGNEFLVQCDMAFSGPNTIMGAPEVAVGGVHGNGGIQYLVRAIGMQKTAEYMLTSTGVDGQTAAEIGWVNRMYTSETQLRTAVNDIAGRIALFPAAGLNGTKSMIREFAAPPSVVDADIATIIRLEAGELAPDAKYLKISDNQSKKFEMGSPDNMIEVWE